MCPSPKYMHDDGSGAKRTPKGIKAAMGEVPKR